MSRQFETEKQTHNIPTSINVIDSPCSIYSVCYDTFKEFFVKEGYDTLEKWEDFLENEYSDIDSTYIEDIANFYNLEWDYINEDGSNKGMTILLFIQRSKTNE